MTQFETMLSDYTDLVADNARASTVAYAREELERYVAHLERQVKVQLERQVQELRDEVRQLQNEAGHW